VLFADLSGFTSLAEGMDPEDVRTLADSCAAALTEIVERYGGTLDKVIGDAVMAVFGAPISHEDDPERAVRAALDMQACAREKTELFGGLSLRIGVNTGETMFAPVGTQEQFTVMGDAVNTASRLQTAAPRGGVVVGRETFLSSRHAIEYEELPPLEVKGKEEPVPAWAAIAARGRVSERPTSGAPLVGRSTELELLTTVWRQVLADRRPHLVTILGPPGIGKSRLLRELTGVVEEAGRLVKGRCLPYGETTGFGAFGQQVQQAAGILESDPAPVALEKLERRVTELVAAEDAEEATSHLAVLLGLSAEGAPDKQLLFYSARRFVEGLAREHPTVLAFEDIHWAEPALLELLLFTAARIHEGPLLLVTLARPELLDRAPTWGGGLPRYTALPLEPLPDADARRLATLLLARSEEAEEAVDELIRTSGGNPLFLEELAASLAERAAETAGVLPTTVQAIIGARLDALPAEERRVLQDASVVGRIFWRGTLEALSGDGQRLDLTIEELEARDFIRRQPDSRLAGDREFAFKHILTREVAYATLSRASRRERHALVARYLEGTAGDRVRESASLLAYHWKEAGETTRAADYLMTAADVASRAWAKEEAIALYTEAADLLREAGEPGRLEEALLRRGEARVAAGDHARVLDDLVPVLPRLGGRNRIRALLTMARAANWMADADRVHDLAGQAERAARTMGDLEFEARAVSLLAEAAGMDGDPGRGIELARRAIDSWPAYGRDGDFAYTYSQLALMHYWRGDYELSIELGRKAYELGMETSHVGAVVNGASHVGVGLVGLSRHEEGIEWLDRAAVLGKEWELAPRLAARATNMWAGSLREIGAYDEARRLNEEALDMAKRSGFPGALVSAQIDLAIADLVDGHVARAEQAVPELMTAAENTRGWHQWLWTGRLAALKAETALAAGRHEDSAAAAEEAIAQALGPGRVKYACRARTALGSALSALGHLDQAREVLEQSVADARRLGHAPSLWPALWSLGSALAVAGRETEAEEALSEARLTIDRFAAGLSKKRRAVFLSSPSVAPLVEQKA
jgi:class 3 adenylate cyclase/tetratricopeptide (TPR) repeat protein